MECGDDMVADDEVRASHGGRRNQGLLWFFGASATLGVAAVTAITCAVIRYGWNDGEFWKLVVPAAIVWAALIVMSFDQLSNLKVGREQIDAADAR